MTYMELADPVNSGYSPSKTQRSESIVSFQHIRDAGEDCRGVPADPVAMETLNRVESGGGYGYGVDNRDVHEKGDKYLAQQYIRRMRNGEGENGNGGVDMRVIRTLAGQSLKREGIIALLKRELNRDYVEELLECHSRADEGIRRALLS